MGQNSTRFEERQKSLRKISEISKKSFNTLKKIIEKYVKYEKIKVLQWIIKPKQLTNMEIKVWCKILRLAKLQMLSELLKITDKHLKRREVQVYNDSPSQT